MRRPALDEIGLVGALRQHATGLRSADGRPLEVAVEAATTLPDLPAAVEVAAYRIAVEALTNVARHAAASRACVRLRVEDHAAEAGGGPLLVVEVTDDGPGDAPWPVGVGTQSIRERAAEVQGTCTAGPTASGGRVEARLPLV